jgi:hypothetical protein
VDRGVEMNEAAKKLYDKITEVIARKEYQPGYPTWEGIHKMGLPKEPGAQKGVTWCNAAAYAIMTEMGYDMRPVLNRFGIGYTNANSMYENAVAAVKKKHIIGVFEIYDYLAQALANCGTPALAMAPNKRGPGHIAVVAPTDMVFDASRGPYTGDAGATNDFKFAKEQFCGLKPIRYFLMPPLEA